MSYEDFLRISADHAEWERKVIFAHDPDCFGDWYKCTSCGCDKRGVYNSEKTPRPCVSHSGSPRYQAYLLERIAKASEK